MSAECWARGMAHRFHHDFTPALHPERLGDRMPRKASRILVSFGGDMFGQWWVGNPEWYSVVAHTLGRVRAHREHTFLFLTKHPALYHLVLDWPDNAWLGISLTGAEPPERQAAMWKDLERVPARVRWLSYEPAIKELAQPIPHWIRWVVLGGWSGKRPLSGAGFSGVLRTLAQCIWQGMPYWEKSNLSTVLEAPLHQEVPQ